MIRIQLPNLPNLLLWVILAAGVSFAEPVKYTLHDFIITGLEKDGILAEKRFGKKLKENAISEVEMGAIIPRFELTAGWGPAPGLKSSESRETYRDIISSQGNYDSLSFTTSQTEYDFWSMDKWGPAFVTELKMVQPLNVFRYRAGLKAAQADHDQYAWDTRSLELKKTTELQEYYYGYLYAMEMNKLALEVEKEMNKVEEKLEEMLDEDDESVSQFDLLELKTSRFDVDEGVERSLMGLKQARLAAAFSLGLDDPDGFAVDDTILVEREDQVPSLDSLKEFLKKRHPDLKRLHHGLKARKSLVELSAGELGPEIFLFASAEYAKSWAGDRRGIAEEAFAEDPVNKVSGAIGVGIKYNLNVWSRYQKYQKKKIEYRHLKQKEGYAERGLLLQLEEQYGQYEKAKRLVESSRNALRAADAWLKGAAMKYDVDPSESGALLKAFKVKINAKKDYLEMIYNYNLVVARLFEKCGWSIINANSTLDIKKET